MQQIELDLKRHCIETATLRYYNQLLSRYFQSKGDDADAEQKLILLQKVLAHFDFSALRTLHRELRGKSGAQVALTGNAGTMGITIDGHPIDMKPCLRK